MQLSVRRYRWWLGLLLTIAGTVAAAASDYPSLLVDRVEPGSEAERAGLISGDQITRVRLTRDDAVLFEGPLATALRLNWLEAACGARCEAALSGHRGDDATTWLLRAGHWGLTLDTTSAVDAGERVTAMQQAIETQAWDTLQSLVTQLASLDDPTLRTLAAARVIQEMYRGVPLAHTQPLVEDLERDLKLPELDAISRSIGHNELARLQINRGQWRAAAQNAETALSLLRTDGGGDGVAAAYALNSLGDATRSLGDMATADAHYAEAVAVLEALEGPVARVLARPLLNLGTMAVLRGEMAQAESLYLRTLDLVQATMGSAGAASVLNNLGVLSVRRGDMRKAEYYYQRALALNTRANASVSANRNLFNLADIAYARGDHDTNAALTRRLLERYEALNPNSIDMALVLGSLADSQFELGQLDAARANYERSIELFETLAPDSPDFGYSLLGLGDVELAQGQHAQAQRTFETVIEMRRKVAPLSGSLAQAHQLLASAHLAQDQVAAARESLRQAIVMQEQVAAGTIELAQSHYLQAQLERASGQSDAQLRAYERAIVALEQQTEQLGGADDSRAHFANKFEQYFKEYLDALLRAGRNEQAFNVLERYRARSLLALLAERENELDFALTPEQSRQRREAERLVLDVQTRLVEQSEAGASTDTLQALLDELAEARLKRDGLTARLRREQTDFAQLRYPTALTLSDAQAALDADTTMLSYSVGATSVDLFVLSQKTFAVHRIDLDDASLRDEVNRFRALLQQGRTETTASAALLTVGHELYKRLVAPAALAPQTRVMVVPDGPLHSLPFAALVTSAPEAAPRYLVEAHSLHQVLSITLAQQVDARLPMASARSPDQVITFGDPAHVPGLGQTDSLHPLARVQSLPALPHARAEAEAVARLYAERGAAFLGDQATEDQLRQRSGDAALLHVAAHTLVDHASPLDSALVLRLGESEAEANNGLLQAWEIFDHVRLPGTLVVLSACESAIGQAASGEGMLGLNRAFRFAGAGGIVSSLWRVADAPTRELMILFHERLAAGQRIDESLRAAQRALIASGDTNWLDRLLGDADRSHPYYWAGFQLSGSPDNPFGPERPD